MMLHVLGISAAIAFVMLCTLLPFMPGSYDSLAGPVSFMARIFGWVSLLLVPVGALWLLASRVKRFQGKEHVFGRIALVVWSIVLLAVSFVALTTSGFVLGIATLLLGGYATSLLVPRVKELATLPSRHASVASLYLIIVPLAVFVLQRALIPPAIEFSRDRAIENSAQLIADIESHRAANGQYPTSLLSAWRDYSPRILGIDRYQYEKRGDAFNLVFEQPALNFGTREFVVYNPRDEQVFTSHALDLLQNTPEQLRLEWTRGHYAVHAAKQPHWKYFWFD